MEGHEVSVMGVPRPLVPGAANNKEVVPMNDHGGIVARGVVRRADGYEAGESPFQKVRGI